MSIAGKIAVVSGASRGIGKAISDTLQKMGAEVIASTPEQFTEQIASDTKKWAKIVKERNIKAD